MNCNETLNKFFYNKFPIFPNYCVDFNNSHSMSNYYSTDDMKLTFFTIEFDQEGRLGNEY